jgi:argininosuccinate lyase
MSPRVGFIDIADRFCTGSSIMPQKKNPDVPELARGKTGRVNGHLVALLTLMKGQPLAYNKDNQEDKEPLFDTTDTVIDTLRIFADMARGITVKPEAMRAAALQGYATATDLADYLVKKGMPFRDAHEAVARAVRACDELACDLADLPLEKLRSFSDLIGEDVFAVLTLEGSVAARDHIGGTAQDTALPNPAPHRHEYLQIHVQLEGTTTHFLDGAYRSVPPGTVCFILPFKTHYIPTLPTAGISS